MKKALRLKRLCFEFTKLLLHHREWLGGIAEAFEILYAHAIGHGEEQVRHRLAASFDVTSCFQGAAAVAGEDDGQVVMGVAIAVGIAAAVNDHGIVEERIAIHVLGFLHLLQEPGELLHVPEIDLADLPDHFLVALVMRQMVVAFGNADVGVAAIISVAREQESGDAGAVGLEGEEHHAVHELHVFLEAGGNPGRRFHAGIGHILEFLGAIDAFLDFAHAGEIFIEFRDIATAELSLQRAGIVHHEIQDRTLLRLAHGDVLFALADRTFAKQSLEQ